MLAHYPLQPPSGLVLPATSTAWQSAFPSSTDNYIPTPHGIYTCTESSSPLVDGIDSGKSLAQVNNALLGRRAVGLAVDDGSLTIHPTRGVECIANADRFKAGDNDWYEPSSTEGFAWLIVFRTLNTGTGTILGKREGGDLYSYWKGYYIGINASGQLEFRLSDSCDIIWETSTEDVGDGAWHCALLSANRDASNNLDLYLYSDIGDENETGGSVGGITSSGYLSIGETISSGGDSDNAARVQVAYAAYWQFAKTDNADYQTLTDQGRTAFERFWTAHEPRQNVLVPEWSSSSCPDCAGRKLELNGGGLVGWPAGQDATTGELVAKYHAGVTTSPETYPPQYPYTVLGGAALDEGGFGPASDNTHNLLGQSEDFNGNDWEIDNESQYTIEVAANVADAPDHMRTADRLKYKNIYPNYNKRIYQGADDAVTADTKVTASVWVRVETLSVGTANGPWLYLGGPGYNPPGSPAGPPSGGSTNDDFTCWDLSDDTTGDLYDQKWVRLSHTFTSQNGETPCFTLAMDFDGSNTAHYAEVLVWGAQLEENAYAGPYVPTAAPVFNPCGDPLYDDLNEAGSYSLGDTGRVQLKARFPFASGAADDRTLITVENSESSPNDIKLSLLRDVSGSSSYMVFKVVKGGSEYARATSTQALPDGTGATAQEIEIEFAWDFTLEPSTDVLSLIVKVPSQPEDIQPADSAPSGTIDNFAATWLRIAGHADNDTQPDAQIYDVKVYDQ